MMITYALLQAKNFEYEGDHEVADILLKTAQIDEDGLSIDSIFFNEEKAWQTVYSRNKDNPEEIMPNYSIFSGILALFIREEIQILFEQLIKNGQIDTRSSISKLQSQIQLAIRFYVAKRKYHNLPDVNISLLKSAVKDGLDKAMGLKSRTVIMPEDRRSIDRGTPDRRSSNRRIGGLRQLMDNIYQSDIDEQYFSVSTENIGDIFSSDIETS